VTLSIGITAASEQTMFFDTLMSQAETALEWAMNNGGNRVTSFGETQLLGDGPSRQTRHDGQDMTAKT